MKNLLVFSFFPAFVPPKSGGEVRLFNFYFELSRFFNITLLSSGHLDSDIETIWHTNNFAEKRIPKDSHFVEQWQKLSVHAGEGDLSGPCIAASGKFFTKMHNVYLEQYPISDIIIHDSPFTLYYDLFNQLDNKPRIYNSYNCEYELYKKLHASSSSNKIQDIVCDIEVRLLKSASLVTYCGADDLAAFEKTLSRTLPQTLFIPNGMTSIAVQNTKLPNIIKRAVFIGSGHLPNVQAAEYIVKIIAPACSEIIFDLIGNCLIPGNYPNNVIRHGLVDAKVKSSLISSADIAINPMLSGSGSSLKILDFVAHGVPVLSTHIGMRGFDFQDGKDCLLSEAEDFPSVLKSHINESKLLLELGLSARKFAFKYYSWMSITNKFHNLIGELFEKHALLNASKSYVVSLNDYDPFHVVGGGATRLQGIYTAIAEWSDVVVLCFSEGTTIEVADITERIKCIRIPKTTAHIEEEKYFNSRFHVSVNDIVAFRHTGSNNILNKVYKVLRQYARIVLCEHPYMVSLPDHFKDRFVYSSQNFEYGLKKSLLEWHPDKDILLEDMRYAEHLCVSSSALVIAVSSEDACNFTKGMNAVAPIVVVPNGAGAPMLPKRADLNVVSKLINSQRSVVFLGSAHMPNVDAAKFIVETLAVDCNDVEFHIVGSVCNALPQNIPTNVKIWGVLSDSMKSAVLQSCKIAVNPMFSGSGSNIKLADFLANGLHVVSTPFGVRGYPDTVKPFVTITNQDLFANTVLNVLDNPQIEGEIKRKERKSVFFKHLSMSSLAVQFVEHLKSLEKPKKRMLFVTYRYTSPILGGAESMLLSLISGIGNSNEFTVDVIAPEVCTIGENQRFSGRYNYDSEIGAPIGLKNVRFMRFPIVEVDSCLKNEKLALAWRAQSEFEKQLYKIIKSNIKDSGLAWGWGEPEGTTELPIRWGFTECGLHLNENSSVKILGYVSQASVLRVCNTVGEELLHCDISSYFEIYFKAETSTISFYVSAKNTCSLADSRPLGMLVRHIFLNEKELDLRAPSVVKPPGENGLETYLQMESAARMSRGRYDVNLTDIRGPHSPDLELFLEKFTKDYDIVVTHNNVFLPAIKAISAAKKANISSILIPHAHLDDDYYHFSDLHQSARDASMVLAAPKAACQFYEQIGVKNVAYLPAGIDISEVFSTEDELAFRLVHMRSEPFFLVLGRKAPAKGYLDIIKEIEKLATNQNIHLILIGPDDDGIPIKSSYATHLGRQPRNVVKGALMSCIGLINMSTSESFGIVLLEAWQAGRPVIVNSSCSAFQDLAIHEENALLVTTQTLGLAMNRLVNEKKFGDKLGEAGKKIVNRYAWDNISIDFIKKCREVMR
ncbi:glycosyltransferase [Crenothrix polyspora]|uniref:Glycosyl transferase family 1 n=1 Tax=Crenothrix polyspora TaxID=360316 RepID=A0A1R4GYH1_9GAMM|nr:glycosyltransferase [Crenothrix polyspora]SJM88981.1 Glycosyl transferase family 1 [Crenothrix polyspora]